jgi:addiction module HigA family antidote
MALKNPSHPGRVVREEIEFLNLTVAQAAKALGVTRSQLHRVVSGSSSVSAEMALRLECVIGSTADHWLRMQAAYDAVEIRSRATEITKGLKRVSAPTEATPEQPSAG